MRLSIARDGVGVVGAWRFARAGINVSSRNLRLKAYLIKAAAHHRGRAQ